MVKQTDRERADSPRSAEQVAVRVFFQLCFVAYVLTLAWLTLRPRSASERIPVDWTPLDNIVDVLRDGTSVSYEDAGQLLGNIALFVPLGWLVPMLWRGLRSGWKVLVVAAATSIGIEVAQLFIISGRQSSLDDVILNTLGALVGAVMFFAPRMEA
jgi:glycopeptide antibiotics resistance protein